jgi:hypothetical protein
MPPGIHRGHALRPLLLFLFCVLPVFGSPSRLDAQSFPYLRTLLSGSRTVTAEIVREDMVRDSIVSLARQQVGTPYRLGATSPERGFDCSGLVVYVMNQLGISLPRTGASSAPGTCSPSAAARGSATSGSTSATAATSTRAAGSGG